MVKKVLIAVDGSKQAVGAVEWYISKLHREDHEVLLGHVPEMGVQPQFGFRPPDVKANLVDDVMSLAGLAVSEEEWEAMQLEHKQKIKDLEDKFAAILKAKGVKYTFKAEHGHPGVQISNMAKAEKVDMILMGTRGLGTIRRTILGSVSDYVLHHAHVPVAIYRLEEDQPEAQSINM